MARLLGVEGTCYKRGYFGETFPRWAKKPGPLWNWYKTGKDDRKRDLPCRCTWFTYEERKKYNISQDNIQNSNNEENTTSGTEA